MFRFISSPRKRLLGFAGFALLATTIGLSSPANAAPITSTHSTSASTIHISTATPEATHENVGALTNVAYDNCQVPSGGSIKGTSRCVATNWYLTSTTGGSFTLQYANGDYLGVGAHNAAVPTNKSHATKLTIVGFGPNGACVLGIYKNKAELALREGSNDVDYFSASRGSPSQFWLKGLRCKAAA
jgi:hypothetical protein